MYDLGYYLFWKWIFKGYDYLKSKYKKHKEGDNNERKN